MTDVLLVIPNIGDIMSALWTGLVRLERLTYHECIVNWNGKTKVGVWHITSTLWTKIKIKIHLLALSEFCVGFEAPQAATEQRPSLYVIPTHDEHGARTTDHPHYCKLEAAALRTTPREKTENWNGKTKVGVWQITSALWTGMARPRRAFETSWVHYELEW
jgi:hypothetical protein